MTKNEHGMAVILFGVLAGIIVGLHLLTVMKGFEGGLIEVLRELLLRLQ